jgi:endonuclease-8
VPEGDDVHRVAGQIHDALSGRTLTRTDFRVPALANADLSGQAVGRVRARGKHILIETDACQTVHTHLKMDGAWHVYREGERWRSPGHRARLILAVGDVTAVGFALGFVHLWPTADEDPHLGHLGPDVLGPDWDAVEAIRRLMEDPRREIGVAMIDQRVMAGPGNVYKSESLFLRGLHPETLVGEVTDPAALVGLVERLMKANRPGPRVTTGDTRPGRRLWVYGRAGAPCRRCGITVEQIAQGEEPADRVTYLCPSCQPSPGA